MTEVSSPKRARGPIDRGVTLALSAAVLCGLGTPLAKELLAVATPHLLAGLLFVGSGLGLGLVLIARKGRECAEAPLTRRDVPWLAAAIVRARFEE